jgi:hypothetical protein
MKTHPISSAIADLKAQRAVLDNQIKLLTQALRPQAVKPVAVAAHSDPPPLPKAKAPRKPKATNGTTKGADTVEHLQVLSILPDGPATVAQVTELAGLPQKKVRTLLEDLVDAGKVIRSGNKRSLRFLKRGVEFNPMSIDPTSDWAGNDDA